MNQPTLLGLPAAAPGLGSATLATGYQRFYGSQELADLTVLCGARRWKVHKIVLSANSEFFRKACTTGFKEAKESVIDLKNDDVDAVAAMIYYLYHGDYHSSLSKNPSISEHVFHLRTYVIGDKYSVTGLSALATMRLQRFLDTAWNTDGFADVIDLVYTTDLPTHDVRKSILQKASKHRVVLFNTRGQYARFNAVARVTPDFMYDLMQMSSVDSSALASPLHPTVQAWEVLEEGLEAVWDEINQLDEEVAGYVGRSAALENLVTHFERRLGSHCC